MPLESGQKKTPAASPGDTPITGERATPANTGVESLVRQPLVRVNPDTVSTAVDPDIGEPLVVYHGTKADFNEFLRRPQGGKQDGLVSIGSWFTVNDARAADYGDFLMPAYLRLEKPLSLDSFQELRDHWHDAQPSRGPAAKAHKANRHWGSSDALLEEWEGLADGIIIKKHGTGEWKDQAAFITFRPEQIKSATGNLGTFDARHPDIRYSVADMAYASHTGAHGRTTLADDQFAAALGR